MLTLEVAHVIVAIVVVVVLIAAAALISWKSAINLSHQKWEKLRWEAQRRKPEKSLTMH